jgi:hypothetical protein
LRIRRSAAEAMAEPPAMPTRNASRMIVNE